MFISQKRKLGIFLAFLIFFTQNSFTLEMQSGLLSEFGNEVISEFRSLTIKSLAIVGVGFLLLSMLAIISGTIKTIKKSNSNAKKRDRDKRLTFENDYYGELPEKVHIFMDRIMHSEKYEETSNRGLLLCGKPGTGKTFFARVLADEVNAEFFIESGAILKGPYIGQGGFLVKNLFQRARNTGKLSIVVIDEFDAMAGSSSMRRTEMDSAMKQLQVEMEGVDPDLNRNIKVIGITNQPQCLSSAVTRRFDIAEIPLPNDQERSTILQSYAIKFLRSERSEEICELQEDINFGHLTRDEAAEGFSPAALKSVVENLRDNATCRGNKQKKIMIGDKNFAEEIEKLKKERQIGRRNYLDEKTFSSPSNGIEEIQKITAQLLQSQLQRSAAAAAMESPSRH